MKQLVFKTAWKLVKIFGSMSEALIQAWKLVKLKYSMLKGVVEFSYKKVDGSIRNAVGTLNSNFINYEFKGKESSSNVMSYFDIEQNAFRCFKLENLI